MRHALAAEGPKGQRPLVRRVCLRPLKPAHEATARVLSAQPGPLTAAARPQSIDVRRQAVRSVAMFLERAQLVRTLPAATRCRVAAMQQRPVLAQRVQQAPRSQQPEAVVTQRWAVDPWTMEWVTTAARQVRREPGRWSSATRQQTESAVQWQSRLRQQTLRRLNRQVSTAPDARARHPPGVEPLLAASRARYRERASRPAPELEARAPHSARWPAHARHAARRADTARRASPAGSAAPIDTVRRRTGRARAPDRH